MQAPGPELEFVVLRAQAGDDESFAKVVAGCHPTLLRHATRLLGDIELARDAVQDAWCAIVRGLHRLDDPTRFLPWALRIVARRTVDVVRRRRHEPPSIGDPADLPAETAGGGDDERLLAAVSALDLDHRVVVELHYLEELGLSEVAEVVGVPVGTVKSRLFAARAKLRSALGEQETRSV